MSKAEEDQLAVRVEVEEAGDSKSFTLTASSEEVFSYEEFLAALSYFLQSESPEVGPTEPDMH